jgi:hypothetical protein
LISSASFINTGAIRYNTISNLLEFCNTYTWQNVSNNFSVTHWRFPEVDYSRAKNNFIEASISCATPSCD